MTIDDGLLNRKHTEVRMEMDRLCLLGGGDGTNGDGNGTTDGPTGSQPEVRMEMNWSYLSDTENTKMAPYS